MDKEQMAQNYVNGYIFGSTDDVELAKQELNTAQYIEKKLAGKNPETILAIYKASIDKKVFRTPVGYSYLHDLQKRLENSGMTRDEIGGIPIYQIYNNKLDQEKAPRVVQIKPKKEPLKRKNAILTLVNILLVILIIIMFAISVTADRPNMINYRRTIENEYSTWKQQLDEREKAIKQKERELSINYGID